MPCQVYVGELASWRSVIRVQEESFGDDEKAELGG